MACVTRSLKTFQKGTLISYLQLEKARHTKWNLEVINKSLIKKVQVP